MQERIIYRLHNRLTSNHTDHNITTLLRSSKLKNVTLRTSGQSSDLNYKYKYLNIPAFCPYPKIVARQDARTVVMQAIYYM